MVVLIFNPRVESEAGGLLRLLRGHPGLHNEFQDCLDYTVRHAHQNNKKGKKKYEDKQKAIPEAKIQTQ